MILLIVPLYAQIAFTLLLNSPVILSILFVFKITAALLFAVLPSKIEEISYDLLAAEVLKELISINLKNDESEYRWECSEYEKRVYGKAYSEVGLSSRKEIIKDRLWKIPAWRLLIKIYHKIYKRK